MRRAVLALLLASALPVHAAEVTGQAFYRERMALPPGAVFEAALEDVSRADAPAVEVSRDAGPDRAGPPFDFVLPYDPAGIDPRATYAVRARITLDGRLLFTSDTLHPAITNGAATRVEVPMVRVADRADAPEAPLPGLRGMATVFADAPRFVDCMTGRSYPIAMEADFPALESATLDRRAAPEEGLLATFEGEIAPRPRMEGEGVEEAVVVRRFAGVWPGLSCEQARADADLLDTYWRIVAIGGAPAPRPEDGRREPHMILRSGEPRSWSATVGCNQMMGSFKTQGPWLEFGPGASTMMACPPPYDAAERALGEVVHDARGWRIIGPGLELLDGEGRTLALLEAVYLK